jgi:hypothetical protein
VDGTEGQPLSTGNHFLKEKIDRADFANKYKTVTPTGIAVNDLPYIVMIALAISGLAAFVALKSRQRAVTDNSECRL